VEEDLVLQGLVGRIGSSNWQEIARHMGTRTARQCRDRYKNYLANPSPADPWTAEEDALIVAGVQRFGPKWVDIAKVFNGRTAVNIKNRWHRHLAQMPIPQDDGGEPPRLSAPKEEKKQDKEEHGGALDWDQILPQKTQQAARAENMLCDWDW
jgi:hypothetical protein